MFFAFRASPSSITATTQPLQPQSRSHPLYTATATTIATADATTTPFSTDSPHKQHKPTAAPMTTPRRNAPLQQDTPIKQRSNRTAAERRAQQQRSDARMVQRLLKLLTTVTDHRGNQLTTQGSILLQSLRHLQPQPHPPSSDPSSSPAYVFISRPTAPHTYRQPPPAQSTSTNQNTPAYHRPPTATNDHQRSSTTAGDHQRPTANHSNQQPPATTNDNWRQPTDLNNYERPPMTPTLKNNQHQQLMPTHDQQHTPTTTNHHHQLPTTTNNPTQPPTPIAHPPLQDRLTPFNPNKNSQNKKTNKH